MSQTITKHIGEGFAKGELYAALAYNAADAFGGMKIKGIAFTGLQRAIDIQGAPTTAFEMLYMDIDYAANEIDGAAYIITSSTKTTGQTSAVRARGQSKAIGASTAEIMGVHAQGIAFAAKYAGTINAIYAEAIAKGTSTVVTLRGAMICADSEDTPTSITNMIGAHIRVKSSVAPGTEFVGCKIETEKFGSGVKVGSLLNFKTTTWTNAEEAVTAIIDMSAVVGKADCHIRFGTSFQAKETAIEGDFWYDKTAHVFEYHNGTKVMAINAT